MNEEDLVKLAAKAAGEPVGEAGDSAGLAEFDHAMSVLKGATEPSSEGRLQELEDRAADQARLVHLWHFAAVAVVFFCIGLVVLIKLGFTPPEQTKPIAQQNAPATAPKPRSVTPANQEPDVGQQVYVRPEWIRKQAADVANTPTKPGLGAAPGGGPGSGSPDLGGGSSGHEGSGGNQFGNPPGGRGGGPDEAGFKLLYPKQQLKDMTRVYSMLLPESKTNVGFELVQIRYQGPGKVLVILEAAETADSREALNAEGLEGTAVTIVRNGTVALLLSNSLTPAQLADIADGLAEKP